MADATQLRTRELLHARIYHYLMIFLAVSLPLSIFTTTLSFILLMVNAIVEGNFREKWKKLRRNRAVWVFLILYLIHLVGLLWSSDLHYGLKDIRVKLPLLIMPLILVSSVPLNFYQVRQILFFFVAGVVAASLASMMALAGWLPVEINGYRDISLFISHIRLSLMIVMALIVNLYFLAIFPGVKKKGLLPDIESGTPGGDAWFPKAERILYWTTMLWLPVFLVFLKSLSGIVIIAVLAFLMLLRAVFQIREPSLRFMVLVAVLLIPLLSILYVNHAVNKFYTIDPLEVEQLDSLTAEGNEYVHNPHNRSLENGHFIWLYVCDRELEREWDRVSDLDYYGTTENGNSIRLTLIRYMTSRGLRKDATGFRQLDEQDISAVERGVANYIYLEKFRLYPRIYEVIWEFDRFRLGYPPNGKSVVQRMLYLKAGWSIAREHLACGVGNGDVKNAFRSYYDSTHSPLDQKWRRRAHNQYLTFLIAFGIPGLILCLVAMILPLFINRRNVSFMAVTFLILSLLSMINEDTLETSAGAGFFAFFYSLSVFGPIFPWLRTGAGRTPLQGDGRLEMNRKAGKEPPVREKGGRKDG